MKRQHTGATGETTARPIRAGGRPPPLWLGRGRQAALLGLGVLLLVVGFALTLHHGTEPSAIVAGGLALLAMGILGDLVDEVAVGPVTARRRSVVLGDVAAEAQSADPAVRKAVERVAEIANARTPRQLDEAGAAARAELLAHRAEAWVMDLEREAGRTPARPAGPTDGLADIISPPRQIAVRFVPGRPMRTSDLAVAEDVVASITHLYVIEGTDPADPDTWRLRVLPLGVDAAAVLQESALDTFPPVTPAAALAGPLLDS